MDQFEQYRRFGHGADCGDAGQFFTAIDPHSASAAGGVMTGVPVGEGTVMKSPDALNRIQDVFVWIHIEGIRLVTGFFSCALTVNFEGNLPG